ncbi:MAG: phosphodiesterase [Planctomycetes bacterium ADurb.Bin401]|nr:MAG: phosphodiesterase [Planctomycetes bacterium ADurb.Bin401]
MKIGIISDTHDHHANVLKAVEIFENEQIRYIFHAGDIVSQYTARALADIKNAKLIAVYGNNDGEKILLKSIIEEFGGEIHQDPYHGEVADKKIFMTHKPSVLDEVIASQTYDIVIYGHTHFRDVRTHGKTLVVNPGEATDWVSGKGNVCILETDTMEVFDHQL